VTLTKEISRLKLIGRTASPFVRRVAVTMDLLGIPYEVEPVATAEQETLRRYNPVGRVPALVMDDGEVLVDSGAIIDALAEMAGPDQRVLPLSGPDRRRVLRANALIVGAMEKAVAAYYEVTKKAEDKRDPAWRAACLDQARSGLLALEEEAAEPWVCGFGPTMADVTVAAAMPFLAFAFTAEELDPAAMPKLAKVAAAVTALPEWSRSAP